MTYVGIEVQLRIVFVEQRITVEIKMKLVCLLFCLIAVGFDIQALKTVVEGRIDVDVAQGLTIEGKVANLQVASGYI